MTNSPATETAHIPDGLEALIPAYLGRQRWYAGSDAPRPEDVRVRAARALALPGGAEDAGLVEVVLHQLIVEADGAVYQLLIGERPGGIPAEFLHSQEDAVLGLVGTRSFYDAVVHPELSRQLLEIISGGAERASRVRRVTAEQSNTSLVFDDRVILKLFRRLSAGANPDIEVTSALAEVGFAHVAAPVATWRWDGWDLAFAQRYLVGGSEGWALALTSLRDLYNSALENPAEAGGDFAGEATRLGHMTAEMHLAMVSAFGVDPSGLAAERWPALLDNIENRLRPAIEMLGGDEDLAGPATSLLARFRAVSDPGPALRVHGDYHLGQVMQTDDGWYVLDFEGEPARSLDERVASTSALKDTAGMVRSFSYAARFALRERDEAEIPRLSKLGTAWEAHNRQAFVDGYRRYAGIGEVLPSPDQVTTVLEAYELDKALYELAYEQAYRPDWISIPLSAIRGLLSDRQKG
ncbi:MAG: aminoglycoside phosphotransferase [Actinomycetota bacterium]|nr:aminoglycoside phosphotransferase [Actinomycetota bacterium]